MLLGLTQSHLLLFARFVSPVPTARQHLRRRVQAAFQDLLQLLVQQLAHQARPSAQQEHIPQVGIRLVRTALLDIMPQALAPQAVLLALQDHTVQRRVYLQ